MGETCKDCGFSFLPATVTSVDNATMDYVNSSIDMLVNKNTTSVNLSNMVKVSPNSSWKLYTSDSSLIATKYANLQDGENTYLIVVSSADGLHTNAYTLKIYKSFEVSINYYNVYNENIYTETADTGYNFTVKYTPEITGYTFNCWKLNNEKTTEFVPYSITNLYVDCTANEYSVTLDVNGGVALEERAMLFRGGIVVICFIPQIMAQAKPFGKIRNLLRLRQNGLQLKATCHLMLTAE